MELGLEKSQNHSSQLSSSETLFSSAKIPSGKFPNFSPFSLLIDKIKEKDRQFLDIFQTFISNFSLIDSQYLKIYQKFLSAVFRNGSYQNCIKELIKMYNDLVEDFNAIFNEFDILIRVKTYQDLEILPDNYLNYYEKKLESYLKNIKDVKVQRNTKYLKLVKKTDLNKKVAIFEENNERRNFSEKKIISMKEILKEFDKIYDGEDQLNESAIEDIISQKLKNEAFEIKRIFLNNIDLNFKEVIKQDFKEMEAFLENISIKNRENSKKSFSPEQQKSQKEVKKNLYKDFFEKENEKIDLPLQMTGKTLENIHTNRSYKKNENRYMENGEDDLTYSKSLNKSNLVRKNEDLNVSFQNFSHKEDSLQSNSKEADFAKKRRRRSERIKPKE